LLFSHAIWFPYIQTNFFKNNATFFHVRLINLPNRGKTIPGQSKVVVQNVMAESGNMVSPPPISFLLNILSTSKD
jgi:hypothetical protein